MVTNPAPLFRGRRHPRILSRTFNGSRCRRARCQLGVSQKRLADIAGVSERCLWSFEQGLVRPHSSTVEAVFGALRRCGAIEVTKLKGAA